jgi:hypothetical protein
VLIRRRHCRLPAPRSSFAGFRFLSEVIIVAVRWYLQRRPIQKATAISTVPSPGVVAKDDVAEFAGSARCGTDRTEPVRWPGSGNGCWMNLATDLQMMARWRVCPGN